MATGWIFKKEVSIGDMVAITFAISSVMLAYGTLNTRLATLEAHKIVQEKKDTDQDTTSAVLRVEINSRLNRIEDKLDRVIEGRKE